MMNGAEQDPRLKDVFFLVEATSFEVITLWRNHSKEWLKGESLQMQCADIALRSRRLEWEQDMRGLFVQVGVDMVRGPTKDVEAPTCITFEFYRIAGRLVAFWHPTSAFVSHNRIAQWFDTYCTPPDWDGGRPAHTNAMNFHHCLDAIEAANAAAKPVCAHCNDTHVMHNEERGTSWPCTFCPVPCAECRAGGNGPYCVRTPCVCTCHAKAQTPGGGQADASDRAIKN